MVLHEYPPFLVFPDGKILIRFVGLVRKLKRKRVLFMIQPIGAKKADWKNPKNYPKSWNYIVKNIAVVNQNLIKSKKNKKN
jgi:hypothetical protein